MSTTAQEHFQAVLDAYQAVRRLPTIVAGVLQDDRLVWQGQAGQACSPETQFRIGSITKTMTAVLVLQCRDEGLLDLDDPVGRWIPETGYREATLRELLSHTSGMQSEPVGDWWERSEGTDVASLVAANHAPVAGPREFFHYSNLGFALLGETVARIRGASWGEALQRHLLDPLGLTRTTCLPLPEAAPGWSVHHLAGTLTPEPATDNGAMAPAGQLWSTVGDLAAYLVFLRRGHPDVLALSTLQEMSESDEVGRDIGLGLRVWDGPEGTMVGHLGSMPGFQATAFIAPESGVGVVAMTNGTTGFSGLELTDLLLRSHTPGTFPAWVPTRQVPDWARELLGHWHWGNSAFEVRWHNDRLEFHDLARSCLAEQFEHDGERIVGVAGYHRAEELHVVRDDDGRINHLNCATFVYTREPYDPRAPIPGGAPSQSA